MSTSTSPSLRADWAEIAWKKMPTSLRIRAVDILLGSFEASFFKTVRDQVAVKGLGEWMPPGWHFGQGMNVRNTLRHHGLADADLPRLPEVHGKSVATWDDFYVQVVEAAAGVRVVPMDHSFDAIPEPKLSFWVRLRRALTLG